VSQHTIHDAVILNKEICTEVIQMSDLEDRKIPGESIPIDALKHWSILKRKRKERRSYRRKRTMSYGRKSENNLLPKWYYIVHLRYR